MFAKNWKKLLALLMALAMVFSLAACNDTGNSGDDGDEPNTSSMTPKELMLFVEKREAKAVVDVVTEILRNAANADTSEGIGNTNANLDMTIRPGQQMLNLLQSYIPKETLDISALQSIGLNTSMTMQSSMNRMALEVLINGKKLADADLIMDMATTSMWLGLPGLHDKYLEYSAGEQMDQIGSAVPVPGAMMDLVPVILEALPDAAKVEPLLNKYIGMILNGIEDVKRENKTLEMDGASQEAVVLTYTITEEQIVDIITNVLKAAKDDADLKAVIDDLGDALEGIAAEAGGVTEEMDLYPAFVDAVNEGIAYFESIEEFSKDNYLLITTSLDKQNEIIGRAFTMYSEGESAIELAFLSVANDRVRNVEFSFYMPATSAGATGKNGVLLRGHDDLSGGKVTGGEYNVSLITDGQAMKLVTFMMEESSDNGSVVLVEPTADLLRMLFGEQAAALDFVLRFEAKAQGDDASVTIDLLLNGELVIGLDLAISEGAPAQIVKPENTVNGLEESGMQTWIDGLNIEKLLENWKATGMPEIKLPE